MVPVIILMLFNDPVQVMSVSGITAATHTPFIALTALYVNRSRLPASLRPGIAATVAMGLAGLFYFGFAILYLLNMFGMLGG